MILRGAPWLVNTAAYTPMIVLLFGENPVLMVATVEMKVAHPKLRIYNQHPVKDAAL